MIKNEKRKWTLQKMIKNEKRKWKGKNNDEKM